MGALVEFHETYGIPIRYRPTDRPDEAALRVALLHEEFDEYRTAAAAGDVVEVADALADIIYVAFGTALSYGIDLPAVLAEVHRSNMSKLGEDGRPIYRNDGKVMKGPNYTPPDLAPIVRAGVDQ